MKHIILTILSLFCATAFAFNSFWPGKSLNPEAVREKWGNEKFEAKRFHDGGAKVRATMTYDLLMKQKEFIGKTAAEIRSLLGNFSGFYFSDAYPTYLIDKGKQKGDDVWQIVFLIDKSRHVTEIIVHKNCCD